jgi:hypothetical protein
LGIFTRTSMKTSPFSGVFLKNVHFIKYPDILFLYYHIYTIPWPGIFHAEDTATKIVKQFFFIIRHQIFVQIRSMSTMPLYWSAWIQPFKFFLDNIFLSRLNPSVIYLTEFPTNIWWTFLISQSSHIPCKFHPFSAHNHEKVWCTKNCATPNI